MNSYRNEDREEHMGSVTGFGSWLVMPTTMIGYLVTLLLCVLLIVVIGKYFFNWNVFDAFTDLTTTYKVIDLNLSPPDLEF